MLEGQALLPAVEFAHFQQIHAERIVAGVQGIGDVAVVLYRGLDFRQCTVPNDGMRLIT